MSGIFALLLTNAGGGAVVVTSDSSFGGTAISVEPFG
jgi:hypothetical protein